MRPRRRKPSIFGEVGWAGTKSIVFLEVWGVNPPSGTAQGGTTSAMPDFQLGNRGRFAGGSHFLPFSLSVWSLGRPTFQFFEYGTGSEGRARCGVATGDNNDGVPQNMRSSTDQNAVF